MLKQVARVKRATKTRAHIARQKKAVRLVIFRTPRHIYAQVIKQNAGRSETLASASTLEKEIRQNLAGSKIEQATLIGNKIAERAEQAGISKIPFDRSGYKYHGRVKALAEAAREGGLID